MVYFAGHGMEMGGENWLLPVDAAAKTEIDIDKEAISLRTVMLAVSNGARLGLVILDACRNNPSRQKCCIRPTAYGRTRPCEIEPDKYFLLPTLRGTAPQAKPGRAVPAHSPQHY